MVIPNLVSGGRRMFRDAFPVAWLGSALSPNLVPMRLVRIGLEDVLATPGAGGDLGGTWAWHGRGNLVCGGGLRPRHLSGRCPGGGFGIVPMKVTFGAELARGNSSRDETRNSSRDQTSGDRA